MNVTVNNNFEVLQIVRVTDFEKIASPVAFDQKGKMACYNYFQQVFKTLKDHRYIYYPNSWFNNNEAYTIEERYLKIQNNTLVETTSFEECQFYECEFYTADADGDDRGIVNFIDYTILNSGKIIKALIN